LRFWGGVDVNRLYIVKILFSKTPTQALSETFTSKREQDAISIIYFF